MTNLNCGVLCNLLNITVDLEHVPSSTLLKNDYRELSNWPILWPTS